MRRLFSCSISSRSRSFFYSVDSSSLELLLSGEGFSFFTPMENAELSIGGGSGGFFSLCFRKDGGSLLMFSSRRKAGIPLCSWLVFIFRRFIESSVNLEV